MNKLHIIAASTKL